MPSAKPMVETLTNERAEGPAKPDPLPVENFAHLSVTETVVIEPAAVQADPALCEKIGEERTFEVEVTPHQRYKRKMVRRKYRYQLDRTGEPVIAAAPSFWSRSTNACSTTC